jgi:tetratricopeptide (TPR) repeat protein
MVLILTALLTAVAASSWGGISGGESGGGARNRGFARPVRLVLAAVLAAAVWLGIGPVVERFSETDITKEARRVFYANTVELIGDFPLAGTGKGTYVNAYAMYEKVDDRLRLSFAHNDYLEFAAENGVVGGGALALAGVGLAVWLAAQWRRRRDGFAKGVGLGALLGVAAILVHGLTDFNLQIPANAVYFTTLAMLGAAVLAKSGRAPVGEDGGDPWRSLAHYRRIGRFGRLRRGTVGPALAALAALVLFVPAWRDFIGFRCLGKYRQARREARSVESAFAVLEPLLLKAVGSSGQAVFRIELARLYGEMARVANGSGRAEDREAFCDKAIASYVGAVAANPIDASAHYETGAVYLLSNFPLMTYADRAKAYFRKALELKPADESINLNVVFLYFTWWDSLEEGERPHAAGLYRSAVARDPAFASKLEARWKQNFQTTERLAAVLADLPLF